MFSSLSKYQCRFKDKMVMGKKKNTRSLPSVGGTISGSGVARTFSVIFSSLVAWDFGSVPIQMGVSFFGFTTLRAGGGSMDDGPGCEDTRHQINEEG